MQDLPNGGAHPSPKGASRVGLCGRGGGANSGGGAPIQALAPGRWRPSVRHCSDHILLELIIPSSGTFTIVFADRLVSRSDRPDHFSYPTDQSRVGDLVVTPLYYH